ncbi:hypothetical protein D3C78_369490 [compost metagenome]
MVGQQRLQRAKAKHFIGDLLDDQLAADRAHRRRMLIEQTLADIADLPHGLGLLERVEQGQVHDLEQLLVGFFAPLGFHRCDLAFRFKQNIRCRMFPRHQRLCRVLRAAPLLRRRRCLGGDCLFAQTVTEIAKHGSPPKNTLEGAFEQSRISVHLLANQFLGQPTQRLGDRGARCLQA